MADQGETELAEVLNDGKQSAIPTKAGKKNVLFVIVAAGIVLASAGGGVGASMLLAMKTPHESATQPAGEANEEHRQDSELSYYELEPIIVNLDEPRLARYVRTTIVLAIGAQDFKPASELLEKKKPEMKSWLTVYLAGCSLEDIRGPKNLNRLRREIETAFNDQLWHNSRGLIAKVLFKEFAVQ